MFVSQNDTNMKNKNYQITDLEKDFAINHLGKTRDAFVNKVQNLKEDEWYHRPSPSQWSLAECADHILQTELYFFKPTLDKMLSAPPDSDKQKEAIGKDTAAYASMEDRSYKLKGKPWEEVFEKKIDKENLIQAFVTKRNEMINWVRNTDEELRVHFTYFPGLETIDAYQLVLFVSGHTTRHTEQIQDIIDSEFFPKS